MSGINCIIWNVRTQINIINKQLICFVDSQVCGFKYSFDDSHITDNVLFTNKHIMKIHNL